MMTMALQHDSIRTLQRILDGAQRTAHSTSLSTTLYVDADRPSPLSFEQPCFSKHPFALAADPLSLRPPLPSRRPCFPMPPPFPTALAAGLGELVTSRLSTVYNRAASQLKKMCEDWYQSTVATLQSQPYPGSDKCRTDDLLLIAYISLYRRTLQEWIDQILRPRIIQAREKFFEKNAFPSRFEKNSLAVRTDMEYKQISVWFQNRRSRWRKEGKELKRDDHVETLPSRLDSAIADILSLDDDDEDEEKQWEGRTHSGVHSMTQHENPLLTICEANTPAHAFPSPYPPVACVSNPFPLDPDVRKFATPWLRTYHSSYAHSSSSVDITQLSDSFARMSLRNEVSTRRSRSMRTRSYRGRRAGLNCCTLSTGMTTLVPHAPLPALLRPTSLPSLTAFCETRQHVVGPTVTSPSVIQYTTAHRKGSNIPRRIPASKHVSRPSVSSLSQSWMEPLSQASCCIKQLFDLDTLPLSSTNPMGSSSFPEVSPYSASSSNHNGSRTPSLCSVRSNSSSPSVSDSPLPTTPPPLPLPLPRLMLVDCHHQGDRLFGDSSSESAFPELLPCVDDHNNGVGA
nr:HD2 protein [Mycoleptodonoides aitchisonii]